MERQLLPATNPWEYSPFLVVSMDYAKAPQVKAQILEQKDWDIVVVDEAHNMAKPHQIDSHSKVEMERWELLRELSTQTKHILLLTAQPHNGFTETFASLLSIPHVGADSAPAHSPQINRDLAKASLFQRRRTEDA